MYPSGSSRVYIVWEVSKKTLIFGVFWWFWVDFQAAGIRARSCRDTNSTLAVTLPHRSRAHAFEKVGGWGVVLFLVVVLLPLFSILNLTFPRVSPRFAPGSRRSLGSVQLLPRSVAVCVDVASMDLTRA